MVVFDNIIFTIQRTGGVSRFWSKLISGFSQQDNYYFLESSNASLNYYRNNLVLQNTITDNMLPAKINRYLNVGSVIGLKRKYNCSVFHSSYYRICSDRGVANITTVHDLIYEKFASGTKKLVHVLQKQRALRAADCIVCVSEHTKKDLLEYYPEIINKDIRVIPNGVDEISDMRVTDCFTVNSLLVTPRSYFLYVGHRGACKGFDRVFNVLRILPEIDMVVVGAPFSSGEQADIKAHALESRIMNVGSVSETDLNLLYSNASFFFFPSIYEGFGIPTIEAMMARCPVVASSRASIPEVVGPAALLFDPESHDQIEDAVTKVLAPSVRDDLIQKGIIRCGMFSWARVIKEYSDIYRQYGD